MLAAIQGHTELVHLLLDRGADINAVTKNFYTAVIWAAIQGHTEIAHLLLDRGADVDAKKMPPGCRGEVLKCLRLAV